MKLINILINKTNVFQSVVLSSSYVGIKTGADNPGNFYDRVTLNDGDRELFDRYWKEAADAITETLKDFICEISLEGDTLHMQLEMSGSFDSMLIPSIKEGIFSWIVALVSRDWFRVTMPEKSVEWEAAVSKICNSLLSRLYHRTRPRRHNLIN